MPPDSPSIQLQQFVPGFLLAFVAQKRNPFVLIPPLFPARSILHNQHRSRRELSDSLKNRKRRRRITKSEEEIERGWIHGRSGIFCRKNRPNFRPKGELAIVDLVIDQFN